MRLGSSAKRRPRRRSYSQRKSASVMLLSRYNAPHTTFWVLYIAISARNQMNVYMENGLTCILSDVDAHVETRHLLINAPISASMTRNRA